MNIIIAILSIIIFLLMIRFIIKRLKDKRKPTHEKVVKVFRRNK